MDDTPEWIKQQNEQKKKHKAMATQQAQRIAERAAIFAAQGTEVWQRFVVALKLNAEALSKLEGDALSGATAPQGTPPISCQVNVERRSVKRGPKLTSVVFHYDRSDVIRVTPQSGQDLQLTIGPDNRIGFSYKKLILTPEKMAETVIQQIVDGLSR